MYDYGVNNALEGTGQELGIPEIQFFNGILQFNQCCRVALPSPSARSLTPVMYQALLAPLCFGGIASESSDKKWAFLSPAEVVRFADKLEFKHLRRCFAIADFVCIIMGLTIRWKGLGRSSAFRKCNFLTEFYNLIKAVGLLCPAPQLGRSDVLCFISIREKNLAEVC